MLWQAALQHLYLVPIMYAALRYGWRGGLVTTAAAAASYLPHLVSGRMVQPYPGYMLSRILSLVEYFAAAAVVGVLAEKDRRQRLELERTTRDLERVHYELAGSIEQMKRSERLYAVGQLAAGLAHEIRNPIASIAGAAGILERHPSDEARRRVCLEIITKECARLNRLLTEAFSTSPGRARQLPEDPAGTGRGIRDRARRACRRAPLHRVPPRL